MFLRNLRSSISARCVGSVLVCCVLGVLAPTTDAGIINSYTTFSGQAGTGPGLGSVSIPVLFTSNPNVDDPVADNNNLVVPLKVFNSVGVIDIVFNVLPSGGTTEYRFVESVDNNTGIDWSSYSMQLGIGTGGSFGPNPGVGLDFDAPNYLPPITSTAFTNVAPSPTQLVFSNGLQSSGAKSYEFRIDVPDGITTFTLRQTPVAVPEPTTLCLLASLASFGWLARRRSIRARRARSL